MILISAGWSAFHLNLMPFLMNKLLWRDFFAKLLGKPRTGDGRGFGDGNRKQSASRARGMWIVPC